MSKVGAIATRHQWSSLLPPLCHNRKRFCTTKLLCPSKLLELKVLEPILNTVAVKRTGVSSVDVGRRPTSERKGFSPASNELD